MQTKLACAKGGEKEMRKMLLTPLMVCIAALLFVLLAPAAYAERPTDVEGFWPVHDPDIIPESIWYADGNMFFDATSEDAWTGTIEGEGSSVMSVVIHSTGAWYVKGILTLDSCTVKGEEGTLVIRWSGKGTAEGQWTGQWVILSGTEGLENLHGQGTWWGPDPPGSFDYPIAGKIHFDP